MKVKWCCREDKDYTEVDPTDSHEYDRVNPLVWSVLLKTKDSEIRIQEIDGKFVLFIDEGGIVLNRDNYLLSTDHS